MAERKSNCFGRGARLIRAARFLPVKPHPGGGSVLVTLHPVRFHSPPLLYFLRLFLRPVAPPGPAIYCPLVVNGNLRLTLGQS